MELRKEEERQFHNKIRDEKLKENKEDYRVFSANKKFYLTNRKSRDFVHSWLLTNCRGKKVLDYCCGNGETAIFLAKNGIETVGIDISDISVNNFREFAKKEGVEGKATFLVMDAEATQFPDNYFDVVVCLGVLHHLDTSKAFKEIFRIVKPTGSVLCDEPLAYNLVFQLYRKLTPHLRTKWEAKHILSKADIAVSQRYFNKVETNFFHLFSLAAAAFRNSRHFETILGILDKIDTVLLRLPLIKWWSWQIVFILSEPKK